RKCGQPRPNRNESAHVALAGVIPPPVPPKEFLTRGRKATAPTQAASQNQLVTNAPHPIRLSSRRWFKSEPVEARTLRWMTRSGAAWPVGGMNRLAPQQASEKRIIRNPNEAGSPPR